MIQTTQLIVWWAGAVAVLGLLSAATFALALILNKFNQDAWNSALRIAQLSTARYWVSRMEREGLTACRKEYRRMVSERNPTTADEYRKVEAEATTSKEQQSCDKREWVRLTDEHIGIVLNDPNIAEVRQGAWLVLPYAYAYAIEAKSKELNK